MDKRILKLYLVLDPDLCGGFEGMVETAKEAAEAGATVVQLRAPDWKKRRLAACGREILKVLRPLGIPLIVNDHIDVAVAIGADGVHVGQDDLSPEDCRRQMPEGMILGLSVSNLDEARAVDPALVDYVGIGPVHNTSTKPDAAPALGIDGLHAVVDAAPCPSVAIGGIKTRDIPAVMATGTDGIAVVSAICGQPEPARATRELLALLD